MAFVDELKVYAKAGDGGNGVVRWLHAKGKEYGGPSGGNGGDGGDVYVRAVRDMQILAKYRHQKEFRAGRGQDGMNELCHGKDGDDLYIDVPVGSVITNIETGMSIELLREGDKSLILEGGGGGRGNAEFKSSTNRSPDKATDGGKGEEGNFTIELLLTADVGFIGLPNAGKSSLLNAITRSRAQVGAYAFTTLEPNLGDLYGFILADIPGLIEGASEGKGLGYKFLRHIKRTKILAHLISLENEDLESAYNTIRKELGAFDNSLLEKREIIILTKTDVVDEKALEKAKMIFSKKSDVFSISILDDMSVKEFADALVKLLREVEEREYKAKQA